MEPAINYDFVSRLLYSRIIFDKAVSMNEKYYPNPFKFDPNRFLNSDGSLKEKFSS